jgi:hypothetical protein
MVQDLPFVYPRADPRWTPHHPLLQVLC